MPFYNFKINSLSTASPMAIEINSQTADDRGGIAVNGVAVFLEGDGSSGGGNVARTALDLSGAVSLGRPLEALTTDLHTQTAYTLGSGLTPYAGGSGTVTSLIPLNADGSLNTAGAVTLSQAIPLTALYTTGQQAGIFAGAGYVVVVNKDGHGYAADFTTGAVTDLGAVGFPVGRYSSESYAIWGTSEYFGGHLYIDVATSSTASYPVNQIVRFDVAAHTSEVIATGNYADMASFTVDPALNRWYFHYEGNGFARSGDETLGYASASFSIASPPTLTGAAASQAVADNATIRPFSTVTVGDTDPNGASDTVTITVTVGGVASDADGALSGVGLTKTGTGTYALAAGSPTAATSALDALVFTPTANQVAPGQTVTTGFTLSASSANGSTSDATTTVVATSVNDTPAIAGAAANQPVSDRGTINPFAHVTVTDADTGQGETATVTLSNPANGALTGGGFTATATPGVYTVSAPAGAAGASAAAIQADLRAATFTPVPGFIGQPATGTTFTVKIADGGGAVATDGITSVSATHTTNTPPTIGGFAAGQTTDDKTAVKPFAAATVQDPDAQQQTVTVTLSAAANGVLSGGGFAAVSGSPGVYSVTAPDAATAQADLRALTFTPTANQVAPGATTPTGFTVQVSDTQTTVQNTQTTEAATSVNDPAAFGAFQTAATQTPATPVLLQTAGLTVSDPDVNASVRSGFVSIVAGGVAGDVLAIQGTLPTGVTASYDSANYVLTLSGASTDAAYAQALSQVTFVHNGVTDTSTRSVAFNVVDDQGVLTRSTSETVSVGAYTFTGTTSTASQTTSQQAGYTTQTDNLVRASPNDPALTDPSSPLSVQVKAEQQIALQLDQGRITPQDAQSALFHLVDGTTSVAEISYAFFTGRTPTAAGLTYLVHSGANPTDLNDAYYQQFTTENRYINFGVNLATGSGAGAAAFQANYGALSLSDATAKAYQAIFGITPTADKVTAILSAQVSDGLGGTETRAQYFADITGGSAAAQKAAAIGFLLADSVKEGFGTYQQADLHFLQDLARGTAAYNVDLLAAYTQAPALVGQPVVDPTLGG